ncbi:MAG: hypothetical protein K6F14_02575 [Clostridiales bacterium]|nr:hypothetical protein [Clostridiales bacterium]
MELTEERIYEILGKVFDKVFKSTKCKDALIMCENLYDEGPEYYYDILVQFPGPTFMDGYYKHAPIHLEAELSEGEGALYIDTGKSSYDCADLDKAMEIAKKFNRLKYSSRMWKCTCKPTYCLTFSSGFEFNSEDELEERIEERLRLFIDDEFTSKIKPILDLFE